MDEKNGVDYIHIASDIDGHSQKHWPIKYIKNNNLGDTHFSWSQLFYLSHRYLKEIELFIKTNNSFYYEFLLPTLAYSDKRFVIRQFENYGYHFQLSWGPAELYEYKYKHEQREDTFYHPIKNLEIVDWE